jgi:outer membrane protein
MSNFYTGVKAVVTAVTLLLGGLALASPTGSSVPVSSVEDAVGGLVSDALSANLELDAAGGGVAQRLAALDQARALYLPSLDFSARYTRANGGRTIDFPVGDLLNPVYATLNQITGGSRFPAVQNQEINFQRTREQDTSVSLTQPLYDPRISAGRVAAQSQYEAASAARIALA